MISEKSEVLKMSFCYEMGRVTGQLMITIGLIALAGPSAAAGIRVTAGDLGTTAPGSTSAVSAPEAADIGDEVVLTVLDETLTITQSGSLLSLMGLVRNDGDETVVLRQLEAAAFDTEGTLIAVVTGRLYGDTVEPSSVVGPDEGVAPGASAAFAISLAAPTAAVDTVRIRASGIAADVGIAEPPLEAVTEWEIDETQYGIPRASCVMRNPGADDLVGISATVVLTNPDGTVLAVERVYPRGERIGGYLGGIRAGQEMPVEIFFRADLDRVEAAELDVQYAGRVYNGGSFRYGVVGVARNTGVGGSVWRSSLTLTNRSGAAAAVALRYYHDNESADAALVIANGETVHHDDVARSLFGVPGSSVGYVQIASSAPLTVAGRTANEMPGGGFGQALPVYTPGMTIDLMAGGVLTGLRGGPAFRTNLGLVNMTESDCVCRVALYDRDGAPISVRPAVEVGPTSWLQLNDVVPQGIDAAAAVVDPDGCWMWSYASVIDGSTNDPTTVDVELETVVDLTPFEFRRYGFVMGSWATLPAPEPTR